MSNLPMAFPGTYGEANNEERLDFNRLRSGLGSISGHIVKHAIFTHQIKGANVFLLTPDRTEAAAVALHYDSRHDPAYHEYNVRHLARRVIPVAGTSIRKALASGGNTWYGPSGKRADQYCLNYLPEDRSWVLQFIINAPDFRGPLSTKNKERIKRLVNIIEESVLPSYAAEISRKYGGRLGAFMPLTAPPPREAFCLLGVGKTGQENEIVEQFGGLLAEHEDDEPLVLFPCTGMPDEGKKRLLQQRVLPVARHLLELNRDRQRMRVAVTDGFIDPDDSAVMELLLSLADEGPDPEAALVVDDTILSLGDAGLSERFEEVSREGIVTRTSDGTGYKAYICPFSRMGPR